MVHPEIRHVRLLRPVNDNYKPKARIAATAFLLNLGQKMYDIGTPFPPNL